MMSNADNKRDALVRDLQSLLRDYRVFSTKDLVRQAASILYASDPQTTSTRVQVLQLDDTSRILNQKKKTQE